MSKKERAKLIEEAIHLTWLSLKTHTKWTHKKIPKTQRREGETHKFHMTCVKDYSRVIEILSKLY